MKYNMTRFTGSAYVTVEKINGHYVPIYLYIWATRLEVYPLDLLDWIEYLPAIDENDTTEIPKVPIYEMETDDGTRLITIAGTCKNGKIKFGDSVKLEYTITKLMDGAVHTMNICFVVRDGETTNNVMITHTYNNNLGIMKLEKK